MAFTDFYMQTTGSDLNSGSDANDAASYTSTSGNWDGTSVFTPTDGSTPASSISVGDYVSVYNTGDTFARYVGQVTNVAAGANGAVTLSTTIVYGTAPTSNSGSRNLKKGGAWASLALAAANGIFNVAADVPQDTRVYVKAGTYANTSTSRAIGRRATASLSFAFEGYKTTPGDMETQPNGVARVPGTDIPLFTSTTGTFTTGTATTLANIAFQGAPSNILLNPGTNSYLDRVQVNNTSTNAAAQALANSSGTISIACRFTVGGTTSTQKCITVGTGGAVIDCVIDGGDIAMSGGSTSAIIKGNKFINQGTTGITISTGSPSIIGNTFTGALTNAISITGAPGSSIPIIDNIFDGLAGTMTNAINNSSGTNTDRVVQRNNRFRNVTNQTVGFSSMYTPTTSKTGSGTNFTNAAGGNFTLLITSEAIANGSPGTFEGETFKSYLSMGAYQPQSTISSNQPVHTQTIIQNIGTY